MSGAATTRFERCSRRRHRRQPGDRPGPAGGPGRRRAQPSSPVLQAGFARTTTSVPGGQRGQPGGHQGAQPALGPVADHGAARRPWRQQNRPAAVDPHARRSGWRGPRCSRGARSGSPGPPEPLPRSPRSCAAGAARAARRRASGGELGAALARGGPTGWRDPHGCACADGSRGSWPGDGCSAGKYACSRGSPLLVRPGWPAECWAAGSAAIGDPRRVGRNRRPAPDVTGMRKRPTGLVHGTRARTTGSNQRASRHCADARTLIAAADAPPGVRDTPGLGHDFCAGP